MDPTLRVESNKGGLGLVRKYQTRLEVTVSDKHSSLLQLTNTLAYYSKELIMATKSFMIKPLEIL